MPKLDRLIGVLVQHAGEALVLEPGEVPTLTVDGASRPVVKHALDASQVTALIAEIAPPAYRAAVAAGQDAAFPYRCDGFDVIVEWNRDAHAVIRPDNGSRRRTGGDVPADTADSRAAATVAVAPPAPRPTISVHDLTMDQLFRTMVERGASDLHISADCTPMLRIDGSMLTLHEIPSLDREASGTLLLSIAPQRNREEFDETGDTDFAYEIPGLCRFRCNVFMDRKGPGGVFRVIPTEILTTDDLGLSKSICDLCFLTKGLVLVTGPTGSGKSTTLAALVDLINRKREDHIITIEDPIEFVHPNKNCLINQREVHVHTSGFKKALRAALREDPDIVLVGEMRDLETIHIALETAETGHLVFGTLHTSSAISTVDRVIDQFPADRQSQIRIMLSESLKAVISQVLCKKIGGGRVAGLEVLMVNAAVSNLIREGKTFQIPSIMQTGKQLGMVMLNDALLEHVMKQRVEPKEAYMKSIDKLNLLSMFRAKNVSTSFLDG